MPPKQIVFATGNRHKAIELALLIAPTDFSILTLADFPNPLEVVEDGESFAENARKKGVQQAIHLGQWTIAEDSGLCVAALDGAPGIWSARFAGPDATDQDNNALLLERLKEVPLEKRRAWYTCYMVLVDPTGVVRFETQGRCYGRILFESSGQNGFGYDPLFEVIEYHKTFGELAPEVKKVISHRARATREMIPHLFEIPKEMP